MAHAGAYHEPTVVRLRTVRERILDRMPSHDVRLAVRCFESQSQNVGERRGKGCVLVHDSEHPPCQKVVSLREARGSGRDIADCTTTNRRENGGHRGKQRVKVEHSISDHPGDVKSKELGRVG